MLQETSDKQLKCAESIKYIGTRMDELEGEKEELVAAQALEKKRKVLEYTYYDKELKKCKTELEKMETQKGKASETAGESQAAEERLQGQMKDCDRQLKNCRTELARATAEHSQHTKEKDARLEKVARLEQLVKQGTIDKEKREEAKSAAASELADLDKQVAEVEGKIAKGDKGVKAKRSKADAAAKEVEVTEASLQALHSKEGRGKQFKSKAARNTHLEGGAEGARGEPQAEGDADGDPTVGLGAGESQ